MTTRQLPGLSLYGIRADGEIVSYHGDRPRVLRGGMDKDGYRRFVLIDDAGRRVYKRRASLVCTAFHGARPRGMNVRHLDGSRDNDAAHNLEWATQADNISDKWRHGTAQIGSRNPRAILTPDAVRAIRSKPTTALGAFARRYGVGVTAIWAVRHRRSWAWMP